MGTFAARSNSFGILIALAVAGVSEPMATWREPSTVAAAPALIAALVMKLLLETSGVLLMLVSFFRAIGFAIIKKTLLWVRPKQHALVSRPCRLRRPSPSTISYAELLAHVLPKLDVQVKPR